MFKGFKYFYSRVDIQKKFFSLKRLMHYSNLKNTEASDFFLNHRKYQIVMKIYPSPTSAITTYYIKLYCNNIVTYYYKQYICMHITVYTIYAYPYVTICVWYSGWCLKEFFMGNWLWLTYWIFEPPHMMWLNSICICFNINYC